MKFMDWIFKVKKEPDISNDDLCIVETKDERCIAIADAVKVSKDSECVTFYDKHEKIIGLFPKDEITKLVRHKIKGDE